MATTRDLLLLNLWSEVGKHLELSESLPVLVDALAAGVGFEQLWLIERSAERSDLVTLIQWSTSTGLRRRNKAHALAPPALKAFDQWAMRCEPWSATDGAPTPFGELELPDSCLAGPLCTAERVLGMLALKPAAEYRYTKAERTLFRAALDPFTAALENELRLNALQRLGAAAQADRQTLLSRLGRKTLSETVVGAEHGLRRVMDRVDQVAATDATVLILGETGAGKEVIARAIHERSTRRDGPFVRVNCGAVPPDLIDSELFGHEKGSFTGAHTVRRGWFERADGGTLFLDEIGELTPAVQIRLLRVLQDGIVQRVGGERDIAVDVRVVAATHRDLPTMVQEGRFREDLWYRLAVFPLILPPLRERTEDIPALTEHFVQRAANRLGVPVPPVYERDLDQLLAYRWPGNVRELGAVLERAVILGQGVSLDLQPALGAGLPKSGPTRSTVSAAPPERAAEEPRDILPLDVAIAAHLQRALRVTRGRVDGPHGAAQLLHVNTSTLRAKLRKLGIDPRGFTR